MGAADPEPVLTHPDKRLWPGITKADLAAYWQTMAPVALPGIVAHPLAVLRCPNGINGPRFFQKHAHAALPAAVRSGTLLGQPYLAIDDARGLRAMAQIAAIELHAWQATEHDPEHPDRLVLDLDPGDGLPFFKVTEAAHLVRDHLTRYGLTSFCRTTGGDGLHVVAPLSGGAGWDSVREFAHETATTLTQSYPALFVATPRREARRDHIFLD